MAFLIGYDRQSPHLAGTAPVFV